MENQRSRLSKIMLKNALVELLETKPINKITVYELCRSSQINRSTFYKYYGEPHDVLNEIINELLEETAIIVKTENDELSRLNAILTYLRNHRETVIRIIANMNEQKLISHIYSVPMLHENLYNILENTEASIGKEYIKIFYHYGSFAIIRAWLNNGCIESPQEMTKIISSVKI